MAQTTKYNVELTDGAYNIKCKLKYNVDCHKQW